MYCDTKYNRGAVIRWKNRDIRVRIGLQCGLEKMWMKEDKTCRPISEAIKTQLLENYKLFTKDITTLPNKTMSTVDKEREFGNLKSMFML